MLSKRQATSCYSADQSAALILCHYCFAIPTLLFQLIFNLQLLHILNVRVVQLFVPIRLAVNFFKGLRIKHLSRFQQKSRHDFNKRSTYEGAVQNALAKIKRNHVVLFRSVHCCPHLFDQMSRFDRIHDRVLRNTHQLTRACPF